ncbi:SusC/RagA family TonB-linked outer membrane protein [Niabella aurantiaca]|uniref:SusC/RagA family TonB-linked outer membrane protein n=1 Tax=Niabella aurantiaca TaxID=379900 RepID=UPI000382D9CE|nr:SusC/RagA family TonB-linked outer membrane protein [Niabella aurantiaca]
MRKSHKIFSIAQTAALLLLTGIVQAQNKNAQQVPIQKDAVIIKGTVINAVTKQPVNGANITYKDYGAAISDSTGNFSIGVPDKSATILIKAGDYNDKETALKGTDQVVIQLQPRGAFSYYDELAAPSGIKRRSRLTGAIESIETNGSWSGTPETPDNYLQGRMAGLNAIRRSGTPNSGANLFLRGYSSLYASNQPVIIVDGVYYDNGTYGAPLTTGYYNNPLSFIDLKDIDNITFIKDATYAYGAKAANGAIIITTAKARQEATTIDASVYGSIAFAPQKIPVMDAAGYRSYLSEMLQSKGLSAAQIAALPYMDDNPSHPDYYRTHNNNDWQNQVFKNTYTQNAYLKITGGDNIAKYALSIGYANNKSPLAHTGLLRYNMRFNADFNLSKRLSASANVSYFRNEQKIRNTGIAPTTNPIFAALVKAPFLAANDISDNGITSPQLADRDTFGISNPAAISKTVTAENNSYRYVGALGFNYLLSRHLTLGTTIAVTSQKIRENFFIPQRGIASDTLMNGVPANNRSGAQVIKVFNIFNDTRIGYKRNFSNRHDLAATLGVRYNKSSTEQDYGLGFNSATDQLTSVGYGLNTLRQIGGSLGASTWLNTYLNADYGFKDKYFVTVNGALDGSSRFGRQADQSGIKIADRTLAFFPAAGISWIPSSENFMAGNQTVNLAKIRLSYGLTGNDDIGNYTARSYYTSQNLLGISGLVRGGISDERLQWEQVAKLNAGIDLALFNERLNITLDGYRNNTSKMILYEPGPTVSGQDYIITNSGGMRTTGLEANVNTIIIHKKKLKWQLGFNISTYEAQITQLPSGDIYTGFAGGTMITRVGSPPNLFYGYKTQGVYASDAAAAATGLSNRNTNGSLTPFKGGDIIFADRNGDHVIDEDDRQIIGNPNPDFFGGISTQLTCGNFTLDLLATFSKGNDIYNYARRQLESESNYYNQTAAIQNRWKTDGQLTDIPKATWGDPMGNSRFSDRWLEDGSYLRLKTASLTYKIPVRPTALKYINVYVTGSNLLTFTKYMGYDPEFSATSGVFGQGVDTFLEPQYKHIQVGVRVGL